MIGGTTKDGRELKHRFITGISGLSSLLVHLRQQTKKHKGIIGIDGRLIPVRSPHMALNTQLQSDGAIIAKLWFARAMSGLREYPYRNVLNVHDEIQGECWEPKKADRIGEIIVDSMGWAGQMLGMKLPVTGEYKIGKNWSLTH